MRYRLFPSRAAAAARLGLLAFAASLILAACRDETPVISLHFEAFRDPVDISLVGVSRDQAERAAALLRQDFAYMDHDWHAWEPSPLGRVNKLLPEGAPFVAPPSVLPLVRLSQTFSEQSGGLFNPAIGHLVDLWGFHADVPERRRPPPANEIARLVRAAPEMSQIEVDGLELRGKNAAIKLDFGAISKGYAIDLAIEHLRGLGIRDAMVQIGGNVRAIGDRSSQPWRIPIRRPSGASVLAMLKVRGDESVATSASYDRNFVHAGTRYHHIIDPRTGRPATGTQAVTVVHTDAASADAAATALFVAGPKDWHAVALSMGVRHALLIDAQGRLHMNPGMQARLEVMDGEAEIVLSEPLTSVPASR